MPKGGTNITEDKEEIEDSETDMERVATREDINEFAKFLGLREDTCAWGDNLVNQFVWMINHIMLNTGFETTRVNRECLMILIGSTMGQIEGLKYLWNAMKKNDEKAKTRLKTQEGYTTNAKRERDRNMIKFTNTLNQLKEKARIGIMTDMLTENDMHWVVSESWNEVNSMCRLREEDD